MHRCRWFGAFGASAAVLWAVACGSGGAPPPDPTPLPALPPTGHATDERWASSDDLRITVNQYGRDRLFLTQGHDDFKPSWSKTGSMLTFFRVVSYGPTFAQWQTKLCVIHADGTGFRELSDGRYADFNPTWTRDGTDRIILNRYAVGGSDRNDIYLVSPTGNIGDEVRISNPENRYEWGFSGLRDGRIFIDRVVWGAGAPVARSFLLTPRPGGVGLYEEIARPTTQLWHKLSVSPSETRVAYMLDFDADMSTYQDVVLYYADFDAERLVVSNPVAITDSDPRDICEYPRWSADESLIIYDSNRSGIYQMYAYRLADGTTTRISTDATTNSQFGNFENVPK
jgi:Tol biopolymer transport system component